MFCDGQVGSESLPTRRKKRYFIQRLAGFAHEHTATRGRSSAIRRDEADTLAEFGESQIRVVRANAQSILHARAEHAIWFTRSSARQIVHEDAEITRISWNNEGIFGADARGVGSRNDSLRSRFFVPRGAVDLTGEEESLDPFRLQRDSQLAWIDVIVLDAVSRTEYFRVFQAGNRAHHFRLQFGFQVIRDPVRIHHVRVETFGFEPHSMISTRKSFHLGLYGWTISRCRWRVDVVEFIL